jgi:hypothetical protein
VARKFYDGSQTVKSALEHIDHPYFNPEETLLLTTA